jgi:hypothetical protein
MGDRRVAAALAVIALASVGYRLLQTRGGAAPTVPQAVEATPSAPAVPAPVFAPTPPGPPAPAAGASGPVWTWDRNPFLAAGPEDAEGKKGGEVAGNAAAEGAPAEERLPELRGTVVSSEARMAIFGDRLVPEGERIGEWTLTKVEPYKVILQRGKETRLLELYRQ